MYGTHVLLHISVFLFFWALSDFFYTVNHLFGLVARYSLVISGMVYVLFSIFPLIFSSCPYNTPMTPPLRAGCIILLIIIRSPLWCLQWYRSQSFDLTGLPYYKGIHFNRPLLYSIRAEERAERLEFYAMEWLFMEDDFSDEDMDKFLKGLPGYMSSSHTRKDRLDQYLTAEHILTRIKEHFITCATSVELSDRAIIARVSSCVKALLHISQYSRKCKEKSSVPGELERELQSQRTYNQGLMDHYQMLCDMDDPTIALRASCVRALALQSLLSQLVAQESRTTEHPLFPASLIPMYQFLFPNDDTGAIRRIDNGHAPEPEEITRMWHTLLHDGPLANLTTLSQAVRAGEHAPPLTLSFCWKTLDILLTQLGTIHSGEPTSAQKEFDNVHKGIHTYYVREKQGFRVRPLLDILDTVARGQRLLMLFSDHPKYHNRADVVFGKEYLRNSDLLEAFAHCLPHFISNNPPGACRDFMEKVVRHDDLWTGLQVNLWIAQRSDSSTPEKLRVFEDCCTVIDLAFSALEDSQEADWRAPEFGSLIQRWESFITHCFQGGYMGRATSFRVDIIKARFCNALLAQFSKDIKKEGTASFRVRSQWDVASLARVFSTLGLRDKDEAEFRISDVHGSNIGGEFTAKALEVIDITGPLLIFCLLGGLILRAVPLDQSGVEPEDIKRVWELQRKVIDKERLPLNRPSDPVWGKVDRLRKQVKDLCGNITGDDREILQELLRTIDCVGNLRFSGSEGPGQCEPAEEQGCETLVAVDSTPPLGESYDINNRSSSAFKPTAVTGWQSSSSQTSSSLTSNGDEGSPGRANCLSILRTTINSADEVSDGKMKTHALSEFHQTYESGSLGDPSSHPNIQGIPASGVGIIDRSSDPSSSTIHPQFMGYPHPHLSTGRADSGFSATWHARSSVTSVARARTGTLFTPHREAPSAHLSLRHGLFGLSEEDHSGAALTFEEE